MAYLPRTPNVWQARLHPSWSTKLLSSVVSAHIAKFCSSLRRTRAAFPYNPFVWTPPTRGIKSLLLTPLDTETSARFLNRTNVLKSYACNSRSGRLLFSYIFQSRIYCLTRRLKFDHRAHGLDVWVPSPSVNFCLPTKLQGGRNLTGSSTEAFNHNNPLETG